MPASGSSKMLTLCGFCKNRCDLQTLHLSSRERTVHLAVQVIGRAESDGGEEFYSSRLPSVLFRLPATVIFFTVIPLKRGGCWNA